MYCIYSAALMYLSLSSREAVLLAAVASLLAIAVAGLWVLAAHLAAHYKAQHYLALITLMAERTRGAYMSGSLHLTAGDVDRELAAAGFVPKVFLATDMSGKLTDLWSNPVSIAYAPAFHDGSAGLLLASSLDSHNCRAVLSAAALYIKGATYRLRIDDLLLDGPVKPEMIRKLCKSGLTRIGFELPITPPYTPSS
jgi:hypothetical protein